MLLYAAFLVQSQKNSSSEMGGRFCEELGTGMARSLPFMTTILFGLFHANFDPALFASIIGLGFGYIAFEYNIWWAIFYHIFNNCHFPRLCIMLPSCGRRFSRLATVFLVVGSIVMIVVLCGKMASYQAYIQANKPQPGVFQRALASFWSWFFVLITILMSIVPYVIQILPDG